MTAQEFVIWLEGFVEGIGGTPSDAEWKKITGKLNKITGPKGKQPPIAAAKRKH